MFDAQSTPAPAPQTPHDAGHLHTSGYDEQALKRPRKNSRNPRRRAGLDASVPLGAAVCENAPGGIRTHDLRFRKPPLYPTELRAPGAAAWADRGGTIGCGGGWPRWRRETNKAGGPTEPPAWVRGLD